MNRFLRLLIPVLVLVAGYGVMRVLDSTSETPAFERPKREPPVAEVVELRRQEYPVTLVTQGVVQPRNSTSLTPRVSGRVLKINDHFEPGAFFSSGEVLLELDPTDFEAAVAGAEAQLARSEAALAQEQARSQQALLDWQALGNTDAPSDLVLRKPQLKEAEANVKAAEAQLLQAQRDLERTRVLAPYDGCVKSRLVGLGQTVNPGTALGEIFSTADAEVRLPLSAEDLSFALLPEENPGVPVEAVLTDALRPEDTPTWTAEVVRSAGVLDEGSRELFLTARVADPYGLASGRPPLRIGQPVLARLNGTVLKEVFVIPRSSLRTPTQVILIHPEDSTIQRTDIAPIWSNESEVVVRDDLPEGWLLVVSRLPVAANGATVTPVPAGEAPKAADTSGDEPEA